MTMLTEGTYIVPFTNPTPDTDLQEAYKMDGQILATGTKKDEGKTRWDLVPYEVVDAIARILTKGAIKYDARNWEKGISYGRVYRAAMGHLVKFWNAKLIGEDGINHDDGVETHLDHAICGLMFLSAYEKRDLKSFDDRPVK